MRVFTSLWVGTYFVIRAFKFYFSLFLFFQPFNFFLLSGFLKTQTGHTQSGNWAVTDIIAALEWIKINIASFGGDPTRITLFGHDTGAALVNIVLLTPSVKGELKRPVERKITFWIKVGSSLKRSLMFIMLVVCCTSRIYLRCLWYR